MSKEAAAGDMRRILSELCEALCLDFSRAVETASSRDSTRVKRGSWYLLASSWPDSPIRMMFLTWGAWRIS